MSLILPQVAARENAERYAAALAELPPELCGIPEAVRGQPLPASVQANREPYFSVTPWRKDPFPPRCVLGYTVQGSHVPVW